MSPAQLRLCLPQRDLEVRAEREGTNGKKFGVPFSSPPAASNPRPFPSPAGSPYAMSISIEKPAKFSNWTELWGKVPVKLLVYGSFD